MFVYMQVGHTICIACSTKMRMVDHYTLQWSEASLCVSRPSTHLLAAAEYKHIILPLVCIEIGPRG